MRVWAVRAHPLRTLARGDPVPLRGHILKLGAGVGIARSYSTDWARTAVTARAFTDTVCVVTLSRTKFGASKESTFSALYDRCASMYARTTAMALVSCFAGAALTPCARPSFPPTSSHSLTAKMLARIATSRT